MTQLNVSKRYIILYLVFGYIFFKKVRHLSLVFGYTFFLKRYMELVVNKK